MTAADVALVNEFPDLGAVIGLMEPQATADIPEVVYAKSNYKQLAQGQV